MRRARAVAVLALGCAATSCGTDPPGPGLRFVDVSAESGIELQNVSGDPIDKPAIPESLGSGAAALDFDGDGKLDLFIANGDVLPGTTPRAARSALYRNLGSLRFEDVTESAGLGFRAWCHGASRVDFDADGWDDLYITAFRGPNRFFRNRGDGSFEDVSARWGGDAPGPSTAAAFFDADGDGDLDLYVGNYVDYDPANPPQGGRWCDWRGLDVFCGPQGTTPVADVFYENQDGRLVEATAAFGLDAPASYTLGAVTGDLDDDGDADLYVANDSRANYLFRNRGGGHFEELAVVWGADGNADGRLQAGMGVDAADVDNDGRLDLFVTNFSHDTNTLYRGQRARDGSTYFSDGTYSSGLGLPSRTFLGWGTRSVDLDLDGWQEIVVVSGHVYPQVDRAPLDTTYRQRNQIFRNLGMRQDERVVRFEEFRPLAGDAMLKQAASRGLVVADLDDDGDADFLIVELDDRPTLIRNDSTRAGHWIGFELIGAGHNRDAIGARLTVEDSSGVVRMREKHGGGSYLSTGDTRLSMGLGGANDPVTRVTLRWPSGHLGEYRGLSVDRYWVLEEGVSEAR